MEVMFPASFYSIIFCISQWSSVQASCSVYLIMLLINEYSNKFSLLVVSLYLTIVCMKTRQKIICLTMYSQTQLIGAVKRVLLYIHYLMFKVFFIHGVMDKVFKRYVIVLCNLNFIHKYILDIKKWAAYQLWVWTPIYQDC